MTQRGRRRANPAPGKSLNPESNQPSWLPSGRDCSWCGSSETVFVQRGLTSAIVSRDQYIRCSTCNRVTYDIVSRNDRDIRIGRFQVGGEFRDATHQTRYSIYRVLKVGFNEYLLYLRPILPDAEDPQ